MKRLRILDIPLITIIFNLFWIGILLFGKINPLTIIFSYYLEMIFVILFGIRKIRLAKHTGIELVRDRKKNKYVIKKINREDLVHRVYFILFFLMPFLLIFIFILMTYSNELFIINTGKSFSAFFINSLSKISQFWILLLSMSGSLFISNYFSYRENFISKEGYKKAYASSRWNEIISKFAFLTFLIFISIIIFPRILVYLMVIKTGLDVYFIFSERKQNDDKSIQKHLRKLGERYDSFYNKYNLK